MGMCQIHKYILMVQLESWLVDPDFTAWPLTLSPPTLSPFGLVSCDLSVCLVLAFVRGRFVMDNAILSDDSFS